MHAEFIKDRRLIGQGKMANVYLWKGFAYKCFEANYPEEWLDYEMNLQNVISACHLPTVKYMPSEFPNSIKMDYIEGISLADRMRKEKYKDGVDDLFHLFKEVHAIREIELPKLNPYLVREISEMTYDEKLQADALQYISEIPDDQVLCHLDFHFLNIMYSNNQYTIIDWVNAKLGNSIYDFARSYVILHEFTFRLSKKFLSRVQKEYSFDPTDLTKAILVMALHRLTETDSDKVKALIHELSETLDTN